VKKYNI